MIRQIDSAINNPVWDQARTPAPRDDGFAADVALPSGEHALARHRKAFATSDADDIGEC